MAQKHTSEEIEERMPEWLSELSTAWWRKTVILIFSIFAAIGGWMLLQVVAFPKEYVTKTELQCATAQLQKSIDDGFSRQERVSSHNGEKIDKIYEYLVPPKNKE